MPLVKIMKGNKKEKILDYTAAVIASDVIKTAGTEILGGESGKVLFLDDLQQST